jgi:cell division protease FtsH
VNSTNRNIILWVIIGLFVLALYNMFQSGTEKAAGHTLAYSDFIKAVESNQVKEVVLKDHQATGTFNDGKHFSVETPNDHGLVDRLLKNNVRVTAAPADEGSFSFFQLLLSWFPMLLLIAVWVFFLRQMQAGNNRALGFGKSRARLLTEAQGKITFKDVAGVDEAKQEVGEIVDFLKDPRKFQKLGGRIPKGVLLLGSPGTGKTLLARAIAGEAGVPFFSISGSDFVEMFVGVGASRVRDLFEQGKKNAPCIIFIDEIDAVGRHRGAGLGGGNDEREQTLNQLLVEMDGFEANEGVILIAATNRPDVLDPALLRPGRFDRQVVVPLPDINGREAILGVHMRKIPVAGDIDRRVIARGTPGFSGADLENLVNESALIAARQNKRVVTMSDMEEAKDKILMGPERRSMVMSDEEKKLTAYHEGGHALVGHYTPGSDPIHKATIIPRGRALGMVMRLPEGDRLSVTRQKLLADLSVAMGGRVAEELIFGHDKITTGASSDISQATKIARNMVMHWGMSDKMGPISYAEDQEEVFLGHSVARQKNMSDKTADMIDQEVKQLVEEAYKYSKKLLTEHIKELHLLAANLIELETLSGEEIAQLLKNGKVHRPALQAKTSAVKPRSSMPGTRAVEVKEAPVLERTSEKPPSKKNSTSKSKSPNSPKEKNV